MPVAVVSPRLVGLDGDEPHPLWRLALYEAIGDAVMRRALGPLTGQDTEVYAVWAAARGDVALWAERFSEVTPRDAQSLPSAGLAAIGQALAEGDARTRGAAQALGDWMPECRHQLLDVHHSVDVLDDHHHAWPAQGIP